MYHRYRYRGKALLEWIAVLGQLRLVQSIDDSSVQDDNTSYLGSLYQLGGS